MSASPEETIKKLEQKVSSLTGELVEVYEELNLMFDMAETFSSLIDYEKVNQTILEEAMDFLEVEGGWMVSYDQASEQISFRSSHGVDLRTVSYFNANFVLHVVQKGKPRLINDLSEALELPPIGKWPNAIISIPLKTKDEVLGAITLVRYKSEAMFTAGDQKMLMVLGTQSGAALKNAILVKDLQQLYNRLREQDRIRGVLGRYLPSQLVEKVIQGQEQLTLGGERVMATILFADIRGFTRIMSSMAPEKVVDLLNRYFTVMINCVFAHEGTLDKIMGDAVMAVFGAPISHENDEERAVRAGLDMQINIRRLNEDLIKEGKEPINVGMGIASGVVISGNVGSKDRMEFTVMGDPVNMAFRLQNAANKEQVLITESTYEKVNGLFKVKPLEPMLVKGKSEPIQTYEVLCVNEPVQS